MRFTLRDLDRAWGAINQLANTKLPASLSFRVARILRKLEPEAVLLAQQINELAKQHTPADAPEGYDLTANSAYQAEESALLDTEIEVAATPIDPDQLQQVQDPIEPSIFIAGWFLFEQGDETA